MIRFGVVIAALVSLACLAVPATAGQKFDSKVTIDFTPGRAADGAERRVDFFSGFVKSSKNKCVGERKVTLFRKAQKNSDPVKVGADVSRPEGGWTVEASPEFEFYFARLKEAKVPGGKCERARSKTIQFLD